MSSWLHRVATCYQLDMRLLLEHDLGHGRISDLDSSLPLALLTLLAIIGFLFLTSRRSHYIEFQLPAGYQDELNKFNKYNK